MLADTPALWGFTEGRLSMSLCACSAGSVMDFQAFFQRMRKKVCAVGLVVLATGWITVVAGAQTAHFSGSLTSLGSGYLNPQGVAVDASGNVFVADSRHDAEKEVVAVSGRVPASPTIRTLASGISATGVAVDASGNVFVADAGNN